MFKVDFDFATNFSDEISVHVLCENALEAIWGNEAVQSGLDLNVDMLFTLRLSNDTEVQQLNKDFRGKDKPTNVLSFPTGDEMPGMEMIEMTEKYIGDVIVSVETLEREAREQNKTVHDHFVHLFIHSVLHLLGYDHIIEEEAEVMEGLEIDILKTLGINNPYHKG